MSEALKGLKIIDMGHVVAAPFCAALFADFGADVIKVETPGVGDGLRQMGRLKNMAFAVENRNKRFVTLNLKHEKGKELFRKLIRDADILIENYRPGTLEKLGFSWDELQRVNRKLILVSISGYGQTGPYKYKPGYDSVGMAMGGLSYVTGFPDGPPMRPGFILGDYMTGLFAAIGAMFAIYNRDTAGSNVGQIVDTSLYESIFRVTETLTSEFAYDGSIKQRIGNGHMATVPSGHFQTKDDKWIVMAVGNDKVFKSFAKAIGREELLDDPRLKTQIDRVKCKKEIEDITKEFISSKTLKEVTEIFGNDVPVSQIYSIEDIFKDIQFMERQNIVEVDDENFGKLKMQNVSPRLTNTPGKVNWSARKMGQDNYEVYGELGINKDEIDALREDGVI